MDFKVDIEVLECQSGTSKKGRAYNIVLCRMGEKVGKIFSDVALEKSAKLQKVVLQVSTNSELFLGLKIASKA